MSENFSCLHLQTPDLRRFQLRQLWQEIVLPNPDEKAARINFTLVPSGRYFTKTMAKFLQVLGPVSSIGISAGLLSGRSWVQTPAGTTDSGSLNN